MTSSTSRLRRNALASVAAIAIAATGAAGISLTQPSTPAYAQALSKNPIDVPDHPPGSFASVVDKVKPGVVAVKVKLDDSAGMDDDDGPGQGQGQQVPPQLREFFKRFGQGGPGQGQGFGGPSPKRQGQRGAMGSGFIISADGYVVTNNHVVDKAKTVQVTLDDNRTLDAKVIGKDPKTDLALLKITEGGTFPYVSLGKTAPRVGDWVVAIGNPFGLGGTVTAGIVSARGRDIGAGPYDDFLQIDAPINKGNSGGPTFNVGGEVVGVNTAIASPSGGSVGLAFAIPGRDRAGGGRPAPGGRQGGPRLSRRAGPAGDEGHRRRPRPRQGQGRPRRPRRTRHPGGQGRPQIRRRDRIGQWRAGERCP